MIVTIAVPFVRCVEGKSRQLRSSPEPRQPEVGTLAPATGGYVRRRYCSAVADERPVWRRAFDAAESTVSPRVDGVVKGEPFQIAVGLATQARKAVQGRAERTMRRALHTWNLPAGSDVTRILNELGRLQREVRALARRVDMLAEANASTTGTTRADITKATTTKAATTKADSTRSANTRAGSNGSAEERSARARSARR